MEQLREVSFGLYYGSVDSTPLFVLLAAACYERRSGDVEILAAK
jgi:glycogen debranching enzyme